MFTRPGISLVIKKTQAAKKTSPHVAMSGRQRPVHLHQIKGRHFGPEMEGVHAVDKISKCGNNVDKKLVNIIEFV